MKEVPDITRSLQHKQEQIAKTQKQDALLEQLNASDSLAQARAIDGYIDVLAEPLSTLPLWRRVDRQFWWNEHLSKPFIDAGVLYHFQISILTHLLFDSPASLVCIATRAGFLSGCHIC